MGRKWTPAQKARLSEIMRARFAGKVILRSFGGESLRGYGFEIHKRDDFICRYCGADGKKSFEVWLTLSVDHLLPKTDPRREKLEYKVTACQFCNTAENRYFYNAAKAGYMFENRTPDELLARRKEFVQKVRANYREFWENNINPLKK